MSNSKNVPKYSRHKPSGQARVIIGGKHHYLGKFGSPESRNKYAALIGQQFHEESQLPESPPGTFPVMTIDELIVHYLCLLYTSPSPRDATLSRMPSSA